ncbi:MAG: hypothetical protein JNM99_13115 [Verrucomicrobiaceae bacterium]|nr:hypothetical protein [Verrucomicrobiaceae bacterium]
MRQLLLLLLLASVTGTLADIASLPAHFIVSPWNCADEETGRAGHRTHLEGMPMQSRSTVKGYILIFQDIPNNNLTS